MESKNRLKCPICGYEGVKDEFVYIYEVTIYLINSNVEKEERERPILAVCPVCKQGFFLEDPYLKFKTRELYKMPK